VLWQPGSYLLRLRDRGRRPGTFMDLEISP
jgi:hypothetical protein